MKSVKPLWIMIILVAVAALFMVSPYGQKTAIDVNGESMHETPIAGQSANSTEPAAGTSTPAEPATASMETASDVVEELAEDAETSETGMVERALKQRTMGDPDAPVKIEEFASLSCPHCATFHKMVLPELKEQYIDTGKVYFIFTDFPLNAPALAGSVIARCLPESRYFKFMSFLFEKQDDWAFGGQHVDYLKQNARLLGLNEEKADACLNSEEIRTGLVSAMQEAQQEHEIRSTPSFVINDKQVVTGAQSFENFKSQIDPLLEGN